MAIEPFLTAHRTEIAVKGRIRAWVTVLVAANPDRCSALSASIDEGMAAGPARDDVVLRPFAFALTIGQ
jgi:hypothetical protein